MDWTRVIIAFLLASVVAWLLGEPTIRYIRALKLKFHPREDLPERHCEKAGTPSMGGLFLIPAGVVGMLPAIWRPETIGVAAFFVVFGLLGLVDDYCKAKFRGMRARVKLLIQGLLGAAIIAYAQSFLYRGSTVSIPLTDGIELGFGIYLFGAFMAAATANAVNLTDGLDGLAAGTMVPPLFALVAVNLTTGDVALAVVAAAVAGACMGFLRFNLHPARVWMGDTGSMALGGALTALVVFSNLEWLLAIVGLVFALEALSVIVQVVAFQTTGKRVFRMSPLHHHFELAGYRESAVVAGFWIASTIFAGLGLLAAYAALS